MKAVGETLTKQQIILMKPSVNEKLKKIAFVQHISVNKVLNTLIEKYVQENLDLVQKHDEFFNK